MTSAAGLAVLMVAACPFPARRGTPLRIQRLAEALAVRGHRVEVAAYELGEEAGEDAPFTIHRPGGRFQKRTLAPGFHAEKPWRDLALARLVGRLTARTRFHLIHAHHVEGVACAAAAARRGRLPLVYDAHTMLASELPSYRPGLATLLRPLGRWLDRRTLARAHGVAAVTDDIRAAVVAHGFPPERVVVAMNGVELERFRPVPGPSWRLVYTGTLAAYQDVELLLEAFARARAEEPRLTLVLAASDSFSRLEPLAQRLGILGAIEWVPDSFERLPQLLAGCGIAVLPRRVCHGIPQKLLNYMAAGKAVVASAGSAKVLEHGRTGLVVANGDVAGFARALLTLARDPQQVARLGAAARAWVEAHASWDATARAVETLYERLLAGGPGRHPG